MRYQQALKRLEYHCSAYARPDGKFGTNDVKDLQQALNELKTYKNLEQKLGIGIEELVNYLPVVNHIKQCSHIHKLAEEAIEKELYSVWHTHSIDLSVYEEVSELESNIKNVALSDFLKELEKVIYYCERDHKQQAEKELKKNVE